MKKLGYNVVNNILEINDCVKRDPFLFIADCEKEYNDSIEFIVNEISRIKGRTIVALAGPSGSGKTTSANKISKSLNDKGIDSIVVSFDNFYKAVDEIPLLENGNPDFETIYALDFKAINDSLYPLVVDGYCKMPEFDFEKGKPILDAIEVSCKKDGVIILEGIHALNPIILDMLNKVSGGNLIKIYVSVGTNIHDDDEQIVSSRELRLIRRITRDFSHRNSTPENTLHLWTNVIEGEKKYIRPFKRNADYVINTLHGYEPCVFKENTLPLLKDLDHEIENYELVPHIIELFNGIVSIDEKLIPEDSLLNEFIVVENRLKG